MLPWILGGCTVVSTLIALTALVRLGTQRGIDEETLDKMRREREREEAERDRKRREDEERRERQRIEADEKRSLILRDELAELAKRSNQRFQQWQEAVADLDELWATVEDDLLPWMRDAYSKLTAAGIEIPRPPAIYRRERRTTRRHEIDTK
ncbi:hypothetical protein A5677_00485 [Mycobacterium malmoense]|uniref:Uncharacterized protein n=1 Tax=Mycobacterium malmoense TaxID=1780 RepID=A0A1B9CI54_MYCMA|nr:hypothetical protein [Mycobacterium malmoense]OCB41883.1 hypothetical protein A5677_00485 [Mycobacterium malmoense]